MIAPCAILWTSIHVCVCPCQTCVLVPISDSDEAKKDSRACRAKQKSLRSGPAWSKTYRWLFTARLCALRRSPELPHYEPFGMWVKGSHLFVSGQFGFSWKFREHLRNFQYISTNAKKRVKSRDMFVHSKLMTVPTQIEMEIRPNSSTRVKTFAICEKYFE